MQNNQRNFERVSTSQPTIILHHQQEDTGKMIDISQQGSGVIADNAVLEGEDICLKFSLPTHASRVPFEINGKVVHSNKVRQQYLIGILFEDLNPTHESAIREFITHHHSMKY
ncbi:MAG: PilZ domain-containing protein [Thiotrichales bacterium]|nr:PilZ domain-containing protein [Thiotrichales bacterium]